MPMNRNTILSIVAVVVAASASAGAAEAGEGVRLGFGYPMGSFVATPARGSAVSTAYRAKTALKKQHTLSIANEQLPARKKAKVRDEAAAVASVEKEPRHVVRAEPKPANEIEDAETAEKGAGESDETSTEPAGAASGAQALANQDAAESAGNAEAKAGADDTAKVAAADAPKDAAPDTAGETQAESEETAELGCKKFIPAIGVTVSVGCDK